MIRPRGRYGRRGERREGFALMLLIYQLFQVGFDRIPPTTLGTIVLNVLIYLRILNSAIKTVFRSPAIKNICVSTNLVLYKSDWARLFTAAWFHLDEWHLYYNMASFLWKGLQLERRFGSFYFAYIIMVFSALTNLVMVGVNIAAAELLDDSSYLTTCAAGFSGVIFALKVLSTYYSPRETQRIMGFIPVPSRWACWIELVLIQILVPRASFTGHLAGILVGLAYVQGPLKFIMKSVANIASGLFSNTHYVNSRGRNSYTYHAGTTGFANSNRGRASYNEAPRTRSYENHYGNGMPDSEDEQLQEALRRSREDSYPYNHNNHHYAASSTPNLRPSAPHFEPSAEPSAPPAEPDSQGIYPNIYPDLHNDLSHNGVPSRYSRYPDDNPPEYHENAPLPYPEQDSMPNPMDNDELRRRRLARFDR